MYRYVTTYKLYIMCLKCYTCTSFPSASDELTDLTSGARTLPFPAHVQCYWRSPKVLKYFMEFAIFTFLGLSGSFIT